MGAIYSVRITLLHMKGHPTSTAPAYNLGWKFLVKIYLKKIYADY